MDGAGTPLTLAGGSAAENNTSSTLFGLADITQPVSHFGHAAVWHSGVRHRRGGVIALTVSPVARRHADTPLAPTRPWAKLKKAENVCTSTLLKPR